MSRLSPSCPPHAVPALSPSRPCVGGKVWTPVLVQTRLVEGFDVLRRQPASIGPRGYAGYWPQMLDTLEIDPQLAAAARVDIEAFKELKARRLEIEGIKEARADQQREAANRNALSPRPTPIETSMAEEALGWPLRYLQDEPMQADALLLWSWCGAHDYSMARALRERVERAEELIQQRYASGSFDVCDDRHEEKRREEQHDKRVAKELNERGKAVAPKVERRRSEEFERLQADIVAQAVGWANERLGSARDQQHADAIKANAAIGARRDIEAGAKKIRVRPQDVLPGKVFSRSWLDVMRHVGAAAIAAALTKDGVEVR